MTSWSVVCSISAMRVDVDVRPAARWPRGPSVGHWPRRACAAAHRELDLEHPLEARLLGPQRAHLGQRVARDHATRPGRHAAGRAAMSWRRCRPSHVIASAARSAASRAAARSAPAPDDRQHPAAVRAVAALRPPDRPGVEHERPRCSPRRRARRSGRRGAGRRGSPWPPARCRRRHRAARGGGPARRRQPAVSGGEQPRAEGAGDPRQDHLRLGVAEPDVALEQRGAVGGEHEAGVEEAAERGPAAGHLGEDRTVDASRARARRRRRRGRAAASRRPCRRCSGPRRRRTAACGRAPAGRRHRPRPVADRDDARLAALEPLLDDEGGRVRGLPGEERRHGARSPARPTRSRSRPCPPASPSALSTAPRAGGVQLAHEGLPPRPSRRHGTPGRAPSGRPRPRRPRGRTPSTSRAGPPPRSGPKTAMPGRAQRVGDARRRAAPRARPPPAPTRAPAPAPTTARRVERVDARVTRTCGSPAIPALAGRDQHLVHAGLAAQLPGEGVLAAATADARGSGSASRGSSDATPRSGRRSSGGGASAATPARWSGSARARPRRTRSGRPRASSSADT